MGKDGCKSHVLETGLHLSELTWFWSAWLFPTLMVASVVRELSAEDEQANYIVHRALSLEKCHTWVNALLFLY